MDFVLAVSDGPKPSATVFITTSRSDEAGIGAKRVQKSVGKSVGVDGPSGTLKPLISRPSRDKDRLSFFSSLKSRASSDTRPDSDGSQLSQVKLNIAVLCSPFLSPRKLEMTTSKMQDTDRKAQNHRWLSF